MDAGAGIIRKESRREDRTRQQRWRSGRSIPGQGIEVAVKLRTEPRRWCDHGIKAE